MSQRQTNVSKAKNNLKLFIDSVDRAYEQYELTIQQAGSPVRNLNNELIGGSKSDPFDPRGIIAIGIDHNHEKIVKPKTKTLAPTPQRRFKSKEEELMYLISNFDLNNLTQEQLNTLVNFEEMRHELKTN